MALGEIRIDIVTSVARFVADTKKAAGGLGSIDKAAAGAGDRLAKFGAPVAATAAKFAALAAAATATAGAIVGALGAAKFVGALDAAAQKVDEIGKKAKAVGLSAEEMSALRFAAGESAIEFDALATMSGKALKNIQGLVDKGKVNLTLGEMNVQLTDAAGNVRNFSDLLPEIADGINSAGNAAKQLSLATNIFGKAGGGQFMTWLKESNGKLGQNLKEQAKRASDLGVIFTEDQVNKLTAYRDAVGRVEEAWLGLRVKIMTAIAPDLTKFIDDLALGIAKIPAAYNAFKNANALAAKGGPQGKEAAIWSEKAWNASMAVLLTTAKEAGMLFVTVVTEGIRLVGVTLAIELSRALKRTISDALGFDIDPSVGSERRLEKLQKQREEFIAINDQIERLYHQLDNDNRLDGADLAEVQRQLNEAQAELKRLEANSLGAFDTMIQAAQREVNMNLGALGELRAKMLDESGKAVVQQAITARDNISVVVDEAAAAWREGIAKFTDDPKEVVSPDQMRRRKFINSIFEGFRDLPGVMRNVMAQAQGEFADGWKGLLRIGKANAEMSGKLIEQAMQIRYGLYPQEKADADVANVQRLFAALQARNMNTLTVVDVAAQIKKIREESAGLPDLRGKIDAFRESFDKGFKFKEAVKDITQVRARVKELTGEDPFTDSEFAKGIERLREDVFGKDQAWRVFGDQIQLEVKGWAEDVSDEFAKMAISGKQSFDEIAMSWAQTLISMASKQLLFQPFFDAISPWFKSIGQSIVGGPPSAAAVSSGTGNVFVNGAPMAFGAGGIFRSTTRLPLANGRTGIFGERGAEAAMPLTRIGGVLGVRAVGGGTVVNVIDQRSGGEKPQVSETTGPDGRKQITVLIRDTVRDMVNSGEMDRTFKANYGIGRKPTGY